MSCIVSEMRDLYRLRGYDFMGYTYNSIKDLSFHHIQKACEGGQKTIDNGSLLNKNTSHPYLHIIECKELSMYLMINSILLDINRQQAPPTKMQLIMIRDILLEFEDKYRNATNSAGKRLIKKPYIERRVEL